MNRATTIRARIMLAVLVLLALAGCNLVAMTPTPAATATWEPLPRVPTLTLPPLAVFESPTPPSAAVDTTIGSILFLGDSITEGWNVRSLYPGAVNAGRRNDKSADVLARYLQGYAGQAFDVVVLQVGINDIAAGVSDETLRGNIMALAGAFQPYTRRVVLGAVLPVDPVRYSQTIHQRIISMNVWLRDFAAQQGWLFADYYAALADAGGYAPGQYFQDGLHPSAAGYAQMAAVLADVLR